MTSPAGPAVTRGAPRYHRIADQLRAQILNGELAPGQQVPSETELMGAHAVSRNTVRLALRRLTDEGLLVTEQGSGTFVREDPQPLVWDPSAALDQWVATVVAAGRRPSHDVEVSIVSPPAAVADRLGVDPADAVVRRRRVQLVDGQPYLLADSYLPAGLAHGTALARPHDVPAGEVLAGLGLAETRHHHEMASRPPTRAETQTLRLPAATAVLEHTSTGHTAGGQAVQVTVTIVPGDRTVVAYDVPGTR